MLVRLDGFAGFDDRSVADLELGIVVQQFAFCLPFFDGGVYAFKRLGEEGLEGRLTAGSFGDEGGQLLIGGGFELSADLAEFGGEPVVRYPSLFETGEFGLCGKEVIVFGTARFVNGGFHVFEVGGGGFDALFSFRDELAQLFVRAERFRVVRMESDLPMLTLGHELAVGRGIQRQARFKFCVLEFVVFRWGTLDGVAACLGRGLSGSPQVVYESRASDRVGPWLSRRGRCRSTRQEGRIGRRSTRACDQ
jgi:hypothetical protein